MQREYKRVCYSYEHGDQTLPKLSELASNVADSDKKLIINYLNTNCIMACPGIVRDEITDGKIIGFGNVFSDGTYVWDDVFTNYVERYNIPVPQAFRKHILSNYSSRAKKHLLIRLVDKIKIENHPHPNRYYHITIQRNGIVQCKSNMKNKEHQTVFIKAEDAAYMIDPIMTELFCYDSDNHGGPIMNGYHWKLSFYKKDRLLETIEGWPDEDVWRYHKIKKCLQFIEQAIPFETGSDYMNAY